MSASPLLTELIVVREWLQETAPAPQRPGATTESWKFTKHGVIQALRTGHRDGLEMEMDPDAVNRESGKGLATDDAVSNFELYARGYNAYSYFHPYTRMPRTEFQTHIRSTCYCEKV
jgi:hypothetical protein